MDEADGIRRSYSRSDGAANTRSRDLHSSEPLVFLALFGAAVLSLSEVWAKAGLPAFTRNWEEVSTAQRIARNGLWYLGIVARPSMAVPIACTVLALVFSYRKP